jgi:hypothetical protein
MSPETRLCQKLCQTSECLAITYGDPIIPWVITISFAGSQYSPLSALSNRPLKAVNFWLAREDLMRGRKASLGSNPAALTTFRVAGRH